MLPLATYPELTRVVREENMAAQKELPLQLSKLIAVTLFFTLSLGGLDANLFIILLKCSEILSRFAEFSLFHSFTNIPMDESSLGVHQIEFVIQSGEDFSNGGRVGDHADGSHDLSQITSWDNSWWLVVDSAFETSWAPIDELDCSFGFDCGNGSIDILWYDITSVHEAASHIFTMSGITFNHHGSGFEDGVSDFSN